MKIILLQDIARTGRKHEVKDVSDGHAQNYLIPRKLAAPATAENLKRQKEHTARMEAKAARDATSFAAFLAQSKVSPVVIAAFANEQGHLFKGLRAADIAHSLTIAADMTIPANAIALERPIKDVGEYSVTVALGGTKGTVPISVKVK